MKKVVGTLEEATLWALGRSPMLDLREVGFDDARASPPDDGLMASVLPNNPG